MLAILVECLALSLQKFFFRLTTTRRLRRPRPRNDVAAVRQILFPQANFLFLAKRRVNPVVRLKSHLEALHRHPALLLRRPDPSSSQKRPLVYRQHHLPLMGR